MRTIRLVALVSSIAALLLCQPAHAVTPDVTLAFAGDVHFARQVAAQNKVGGLKTIPGLMAGADITMVNLETSIGTHGKPLAKLYTFQAPPTVLRTLSRAGIDLVTQANNHSVDYGRIGLADTVAAQAVSPIPMVGIGATLADALTPYSATVNGTSIAIFGVDAFRPLPAWRASDTSAGVAVWKYNRAAILAAVHDWATRTDVVVVYVHWGEEYDTCPRVSQKQVANALINAGADVLVGAHPHVLQGVGYKKGALVAYSVGNFVWYGHAGTPSAVLRVNITAGKVSGYSMTPVTWDKKGVPHKATGATALKVRRTIASRKKCDDLRG